MQVEVVDRVLGELDMGARPRIEVINKRDRPARHYAGDGDAVRISAATGLGLAALIERLDRMLRLEFRRMRLRLPMGRGDILSDIYRVGHVESVSYEADGIVVDCELHRKHCGKYGRYAVS
jgi:GTP-binding protein HflX